MPEEMERKTFDFVDFDLKEINEDGSFSGVASVYGEEDLGGDIIDKGAFAKTLADSATVPILWQHKPDEVIGEGRLTEWQSKILIKGQLDIEDDPVALKAYRKLKRQRIKGLSIGFSTLKSFIGEVAGRTVRHIQELKLWEVSIVTFPMLPSAQVTRVKGTDTEQQALQPAKDLTPAPSIRSGAEAERRAANEPGEPVVDHSRHTAKVEEILAVLREKENGL